MLMIASLIALLLAVFAPAGNSAQAALKKNTPVKPHYGYSESLAQENEIADQCGLERIRTRVALQSAIGRGYLVPVPVATLTYELDPDPNNFDTSRKEFRYLLPRAKEVLEEMQEFSGKIQVMVVSGRNEELQKTLEDLKTGFPLKIYGFVANMDELMEASDLMIAKP